MTRQRQTRSAGSSSDVPPTEALTTARNRRWAAAYRQAQADLRAPGAVVWLPDEIIEILHPAQPSPPPAGSQPTSPPQRWRALLWVGLLGLPLVLSYLRAYRQVTPPSP